MTLLEKSKQKFIEILETSKISMDEKIAVEALGVEEALGDPAPYKDFALQRGVEKLMEARYKGFRGQAFTSYPARWTGTIGEILALNLDSDRNRALLVATMNALGRAMGKADRTIHCRDKGPETCGKGMAEEFAEKYGPELIVGIVGYQPAILKNLIKKLGPEKVRVVDLNPLNIGKNFEGVEIWDGEKDLERMADECTVCLATGSALSNNTLDGIVETMEKKGRKVIVFGTTIAFPAEILGLERLCLEAE